MSIQVNLTGGDVSNSSYYDYGFRTNTTNITDAGEEEPTSFLSVFNIITNLFVTYGMPSTVILIMFGMGATLTLSQIKENICPPIGIIIGAIGQYILLPALTMGVALMLKLNPYVAIGCLIISSSPGGVYSTFCTYWVDGITGLSVIMTTFSTVLAFGMMPLNLLIYSPILVGENTDIVVPYGSIMIGLSMALVPVLCGMVFRHFAEQYCELVAKVTSLLQTIISVGVIISYLWVYWQVYYNASAALYAIGIMLPIVGFTLAYLLSIMLCQTHAMARTIGIETGCQNIPVATNIIILSFKDQKIRQSMLIFPSIYGLFMILEVLLGIVIYRMIKECMRQKSDSMPLQEDDMKKQVKELGRNNTAF